MIRFLDVSHGEAVAQYGGCNREEVRVRTIRVTRNSLATVWVCCSVSAARKIAADAWLPIVWACYRIQILS